MGRRAPLIALALATIASIGGTRLSAIAIPWLVLTTTGDPILTGAVGFAEMLPYVLAKALGGPLIDRIGARRIAIWCDMLSMLAIAVIPVLFWLGLLSIWVLMPAVALVGVLRAPSDAAKQALVPAIARLVAVPLERVTGVIGASDRLAGTLGAAGAGVLIALIGPAPALLANAVAFFVSAVIVGLGVPAQAAAEADDAKAVETYGVQFAAGWAALRQDPVLVGLVVMIAFTNLFDQAYATLLLPVWVRESGLDVSWVGILLAVFSGAAIAGASLAAAVAERVPRLVIYVVGFICAGPVAHVTLALNAPLEAIIPILVLSGFAAGFLNPIIGAILFERIAPALVGRVIALVGALAWALMPFGGLYGGVLVEWGGVYLALGLTGAFYMVATLSPALIPSFRQMNRKPIAAE